MKPMTLNTHSLEEPDYESKLLAFAEGVCREQPDIIALQEVNQTQAAAPADPVELKGCGYVPCAPVSCRASRAPSAILRNDNHAFCLARILAGRGLPFHWTWTAAKTGYGRYDEGLAVLSRLPISDTHQAYITGIHDYSNWKTRKILGAGILGNHGMEYFYSVHMGWWDDTEEPFKDQWQRIRRELEPAAAAAAQIWLMGDFNSPAHIRGEGRDLILGSGWLDSYELASERDEGITVSHAIDGWRDRGGLTGMRIDYIWTNCPVPVKSSHTIFNHRQYPAVSDHFGIIIEY